MMQKQTICRLQSLFLLIGIVGVLGCIGQAEIVTVTKPPETIVVTATLPQTTITVGRNTITVPSQVTTVQEPLPPKTITIQVTRKITATYTTTKRIQGVITTETRTTTVTVGGSTPVGGPFSIVGQGSGSLFVLGLLVCLALLVYVSRRRRQ